MLDIDHLTKPGARARKIRDFLLGIIAAAAVLALASAGCGSVTEDPPMDGRGVGAAGASGSGGTDAAARGGSAGNGIGGAGGSIAGARDAGSDRCISIPGVLACDPAGWGPCPPSVSLQACPDGTVLAGDAGACPAGTYLVALYAICIPGDGGT